MTIQPVTPLLDAPQFSPRWWLDRLYRQLLDRLPMIDLWERYVDGDHPFPTVQERASKAFRRLLGLSPTNLTGLIVESCAERLTVEGFRFGDDPDADADAWAIWQASDFDVEFEMAVASALTAGRSFILVEPGRDGGLPRLYAEDASQVIVAYEPGRRSNRLAALKVWEDEWGAALLATLYLPTSLHKFRAPLPRGEAAPQWVWRDSRVEREANPLGEVPMFELRNRPKLRGGEVRSEVADVLSDQDRANHIALNALIAAEFGAFRQKWATGIEIPRDPDTGAAVEPFDVAVHRLLVSESEGAKFGDFNPTDLKPYIDLYESTVRHMAAVSQTPVTTLMGVLANVSAEALALSVAGHVNKVRRHARWFEQPAEGALRLAFASMGDPRAQTTAAETLWADPEIRTRAQDMDAAVKGVQARIIPPQQAQEDLGYSITQRERMDAWFREADALAQFTSLLERQAAPVT